MVQNTRRFGYEPNLPESIRDIFTELCEDVRALRSKWDFYLGVFSQEENTALLSELARASFLMIEESLRTDLTMTICRLGDPSQSLGHDNISLQALIDRLDNPSNVIELLKDFQAACEPVKNIRNKMVAHNDLDSKLGVQTSPLLKVERKQIDRIVQLAEEVLNAVLERYISSELRFETIWQGGAEELIFWLKAGREAKKEEKVQKLRAYLGNMAGK